MVKSIFRLYEKKRLRQVFYTVCFAVIVWTGGRMAYLLLEDLKPGIVDKFFIAIAGPMALATAMVTLLRVYMVPAVSTAPRLPMDGEELPIIPELSTPEYWDRVERMASETRLRRTLSAGSASIDKVAS